MKTRISNCRIRSSSSITAFMHNKKLLAVLGISLFLLFHPPPTALAGPLYIDCDPCIERSNYEIRAIVHGTKDDPSWQQVQAAMSQAARDMGVDFSMTLRNSFSSTSKNDSMAMAQDIYDTIRYEFDDSEHGHTHDVKQVDALLVTIPDDTVAKAVQEAVAANIHVFGLNEGYQVAQKAGVLGFVAQDEFLAGQFAAEAFLGRAHKLTMLTNNNNDERRIRALYLNHDGNNGALRERFRGFNDTLFKSAGIEAEELVVDPSQLYDMIVNVHQEFEECQYDFVLLAGNESLMAAREAFEHYGCFGQEQQQAVTIDTQDQGEGTVDDSDNNNNSFQLAERDAEVFNTTVAMPRNNRRMIMGAFDHTPEIIDAIAQEQLEFTFMQQVYLQGVLSVIMTTIYATTGSKLALPSEELIYLAGPRLVDKSNLPNKSFLTCQSEGFPVCPNELDLDGNSAACSCIDRTKLRIAGVVHGLRGDAFWDTVFSAASQASHEMEVELIMDRFAENEVDDSLLHPQMASRIRSLCISGIDGIFVSIPSDTLKSAVRFCQSLDIPVISINTGEELAKELGIQFIGQVDYVAGNRAADRLIQAGMKVGYCLRHAVSTATNQRCLGFAEAIEATGENVTFGGIVTIPQDNKADYKNILEDVVEQEGQWEGIAFLVSGPIEPVLSVQWQHQRAIIGTFDVKEEIFEPLDSGRVLFTVDQQQYLQGSMPVYLLTYAAYTKQALLNTYIETGPNLMEYSPPEAIQVCKENGFEVCPMIPDEDFNFIGPFLRIWGYLAFALVVFAALASLVWTLINRDNNVVTSSQPFFLGFVVVGVMMSVGSIIPFGAETEHRYLKDPWTGKLTTQYNPDILLVDAACMLGPWLYGLGFALVFSALCAKVSSLQIVRQPGKPMRRKKMEIADVASVMAGTVLVEVGVLLCWTLFSPSRWHRVVEEEMDGYIRESTGQCTSDSGPYFFVAQVGFHILCLLYALVISWRTREIPSEFSEGSWVSMALVCIFQVTVLAIPIGWMTEDYPDAHYLFRVCAIFLQNFGVLCLIFGPKMLRVMSGNDQLPISMVAGRGDTAIESPSKQSENPAIGRSIVSSEKNTTSLRAPTGSDSDTDDSEREKSPYHNYGGDKAREGAPVDRMASLDSDSDSEESPMEDMMNGYKASLKSSSSSSSSHSSVKNEGVNDDLANLAAEITRAQETREKVFASTVGEHAPPISDSEGHAMDATPGGSGLRAMSFTSTPTATPSEERSLEGANVAFCNQQDSTEDDSSGDSSSENGEVMHVAAETQSPKQNFRRMDSDDDDSESSSVKRRLMGKKPFTPDIGVLDGSSSAFDRTAIAAKTTTEGQSQPKQQIKHQDSPDIVESDSEQEGTSPQGGSKNGSSDNQNHLMGSIQRQASPHVGDSLGAFPDEENGIKGVPGSETAHRAPKKKFERRGSPDVDSSVETSSSGDYDGKHGLNYEKNPQEGSLVSHENSTGKQSPEAQKLPAASSRLEGDSVDHGSASTSTGISAQGINHSEASKAEIFRKPHDTPIRFRKSPSQYGDLTTIATGLTKTSGSFLRKVAASFGSGSLDAASSSRPSFGNTVNSQQPTKDTGILNVQGVDWPENSNTEFDVNRQNRPQYQVFKQSLTDSTPEEKLGDSDKSLQREKCDGEVLYFT